MHEIFWERHVFPYLIKTRETREMMVSKQLLMYFKDSLFTISVSFACQRSPVLRISNNIPQSFNAAISEGYNMDFIAWISWCET